MAKLRVFLADDHAVVREGLKSLINAQSDMAVIGEAADGKTAGERVLALRPDVVVMDVTMPEVNGAKATERIKARSPDVKVLALTMHEDKGYLRQLFEAGAAGYVLKRSASAELLHAIRTVAANGTYIDPSLAGKVVGGLLQKPSSKDVLGEVDLSEREAEVVRFIAQGYSNKEIAARLEIGVKTVETYKTRSMEKLGFHSRTEMVRYALRRGWLDQE